MPGARVEEERPDVVLAIERRAVGGEGAVVCPERHHPIDRAGVGKRMALGPMERCLQLVDLTDLFAAVAYGCLRDRWYDQCRAAERRCGRGSSTEQLATSDLLRGHRRPPSLCLAPR